MGGAGRSASIGGHEFGQKCEVAAKQGFLNYYSDSDAIGIKVSVRYRRSGRTSGVVVERGSTVVELVLWCEA